jgi:hypothetical protein
MNTKNAGLSPAAILFASLAAVSLFLCLVSPFALFYGAMSEPAYRSLLLLASIAWFVFAGLLQRLRNPGSQG